MSNSDVGCLSFIVFTALVFVFWEASIYFGLPLAIAGGGICYFMVKSEDEDYHALGWIVGAASGFLGLISIVGNAYSGDGPFKSDDEGTEIASETDNSENVIPEKYRGKWSGSGNCDNYNSLVEIDGGGVDFYNGGRFLADTASESGSSVTLEGVSIVMGESFIDTGFQEDSATLSISNNGQSLSINGSSFRKCLD